MAASVSHSYTIVVLSTALLLANCSESGPVDRSDGGIGVDAGATPPPVDLEQSDGGPTGDTNSNDSGVAAPDAQADAGATKPDSRGDAEVAESDARDVKSPEEMAQEVTDMYERALNSPKVYFDFKQRIDRAYSEVSVLFHSYHCPRLALPKVRALESLLGDLERELETSQVTAPMRAQVVLLIENAWRTADAIGSQIESLVAGLGEHVDLQSFAEQRALMVKFSTQGATSRPTAECEALVQRVMAGGTGLEDERAYVDYMRQCDSSGMLI